MTRPSVREILTDAADTQHGAVLTWQEARALLNETEDLWWLRSCMESMTANRDTSSTMRVGMLRSLLATTQPDTSTTDPRPPTSARQPEGGRPMSADAIALGLAEESFRHSWDSSDERRIHGAWVQGLCCECGEFVPYGTEVAHVATALAPLIRKAQRDTEDGA